MEEHVLNLSRRFVHEYIYIYIYIYTHTGKRTTNLCNSGGFVHEYIYIIFMYIYRKNDDKLQQWRRMYSISVS